MAACASEENQLPVFFLRTEPGRGLTAGLFSRQGMHSYRADSCTRLLPSEFHAAAAVRMAARARGGGELPFLFVSQDFEPSQGAASLRGPSPSKPCIAIRRLSVRGLFFRNSVQRWPSFGFHAGAAVRMAARAPGESELPGFFEHLEQSQGAASLRGLSPSKACIAIGRFSVRGPFLRNSMQGRPCGWPPAPRGRVSSWALLNI